MKIAETLKDSNILLKGVTKAIKNETKKQKGWSLSKLLSTLGASLLGKLLAKKGAGSKNKKGTGIVRACNGHPSSSALQKQWDF